MRKLNMPQLRLLLQLLFVVGYLVLSGFTSSAWAAGYTLTTKASPTTGGSVTPFGGSYQSGARVTITASPKTGYKFSSWSGCSSSTTTCTVTMGKNTTVTANFVALPTYTLSATASPAAGGTVAPYGGSYMSGATVTLTASPKTGYKFSSWSGCSSSTSYMSGATVTLTASPKTGYKFSSWSGCSSSTTTCTVTMGKNTTVTANFVALPPVPQTPSLNTPYNGQSDVSQSKVNFSWSVGNASVAKVSNYRIVISQYQDFRGFRDDNANSSCDSTCATTTTGSVTSYIKDMNVSGQTYWWKVRASGEGGLSAWSVPRSFTTKFSSTVSAIVGGTGFGSIVSKNALGTTDNKIDCPAQTSSTKCKSTFDTSSIRLDAIPVNGTKFTGWGGACRGTTGTTCILKANNSSSVVSAGFDLLPSSTTSLSSDQLRDSISFMEVVDVAGNGNTVIQRISGIEAYRKYSWVKDVVDKNKSGNLRGMVINAKAKKIYSFSGKIGSKLALFQLSVEFAKQFNTGRKNIDSILSGSDSNSIKASKISAEVSGACARTVGNFVLSTVDGITFVLQKTKWINPTYWTDYVMNGGKEFDKSMTFMNDLTSEMKTSVNDVWSGNNIYQHINIYSDKLIEAIQMSNP